MRVMLMHRTNPSLEAGVPPSQELIAGVGRMIGEMAQAGVFLDGTGLRSSSLGVRLDFVAGTRTITRGPFSGRNERTAGVCVLRVRSLDEAIEWASRFGAIIGDAQIDIRPVTEPWDLGLAPKPSDQPTSRYMAVYKADEQFEAGGLPTPAIVAAIERLKEEMAAAGSYLAAHLLQPSARAKRVGGAGGKPTVIDGPFAESKELIAGFALLRLNSMDEALAWAHPYASCLGDIELEVHPLREPSDFT